MMKPDVDPKEQAFIEQALSAAARAERWDRVRVIVAKAAAIGAAIFFLGVRPPGPELGVEATICVVLGSVIVAAAATIRSLIQRNTRLILQAIAAPRPQSDSAPAPARE
jgi:hypothetical protein